MKHYFKKVTSLLLAILLAFSIIGIIPASATTASDGDINFASGKTVTFGYGSEVTSDASWGVSVVNSGLTVLTDGVNNGTDWWVNNGNPNIGLKESVIEGPYSLTVDLGDEYPINRASLYNYTRVNWGVHPMEAVTYSYSTDGENWFALDTVAVDDAVVEDLSDPKYTGTDAPLAIYEFALSFKTVNARYVKADFENNSYGIIGINEFEVYGTNIAYGTSVSFEYGSEVETNANWDATAVTNGLNVLTNGVNNGPNFWVNNSTSDPTQSNPYIGLNQAYVTGPYAFIVDLGELTSVGRLQSYFYDRTEWSVAVPATVDYYVSADGTSWNLAGSVASGEASTEEVYDSNNPTEQQPTIYNYRFDGNFDNVRYVKIAFEAHADSTVKIGFGEIEVFEATEGYCCTLNNGTITITDYIGNDTELEIPAAINGYPVTAIADNAFSNCTDLRTVIIPDTVESIGANSFAYCTSITIYNSDCVINGTIGASDVVITAYKNSTAEAYATENNLTFVEIECTYHVWNEGEVIKAETCTEDGAELYTCKKCKTEKICEVPATGHTEDEEWTITKDENCTEDGEKIKYCTVCSEIVAIEVIPATGHIVTGEWIIEKHPNCVETGRKVDICIICGDVAMSQEIPALGHTEVVDAAVAATCVDTGLTEGIHCADCNEIIVPQIETEYTDHEEVVVDAKDATYFEDGYTGDTICSICKTVITEGETIAKKTLDTPNAVIKSKNKKFTVKYKNITDATGFIVKYKYKGKTVINKYETAETAKAAFKKLSKGTYKVKVRACVEQDNQIAYSKWTKAVKVKIK